VHNNKWVELTGPQLRAKKGRIIEGNQQRIARAGGEKTDVLTISGAAATVPPPPRPAAPLAAGGGAAAAAGPASERSCEV